jgi:hypothetical protein
MKLSEFKAGSTPQEAEEELLYPRSEMADPPITIEEAREARKHSDYETTCRRHKGHITHSPLPSDTDGRVYWCPEGREYWRLSKKTGAMYKPLKYGWNP